MNTPNDTEWLGALQGLKQGDFTWLEPYFTPDFTADGARCRIIEWYEVGAFEHAPQALAEALTCAGFLGRTGIAAYLLQRGVDVSTGTATGFLISLGGGGRGPVAGRECDRWESSLGGQVVLLL